MVYPITILIIAALVTHGARQRLLAAATGESLDRSQEGWPLLIAIRLSGLALFIAAIVGFRRPSPLPPAAQWTGVALFAISSGWLAWMYTTLGKNLTDTVVTRSNAEFVSHGPYRYIRNPMYTGALAAGLSLALIQGNWIVALLSAVSFTLLTIRTRTEERYLIARFGRTYQDYMARVGRFWPRII